MGVLLMILLDEHMQLVHDEEQQPSDQLRESLIRCNSMCAYASKDLLYRFNDRGDLFVVSLSRPNFHSIAVKNWEREVFRRERRLALDNMVIRDIGCEQSRVYLDGFSFTVPTELLLR